MTAPADPELEALIDEEFGCPPVISDLAVGVETMMEARGTQDDESNGSAADAGVTAAKYIKANRPVVCHRKNFVYAALYDVRLAGRMSERDVEPYSPQPYVVPRRFEHGHTYGDRYRHSKFPVVRRRRR